MKHLADFLAQLKEYRISLFKSHIKYILENYLEKWIIKAVKVNSNSDFDSICLIVEDRSDFLIRFSILNTLFMTRLSKKIFLYTTKAKFKEMKELFSDIDKFVVIIELNINDVDITNISVAFYNSIFKNPDFWKSIPTKKILIFQTDSILIEPLDSLYFKYDYIGAPFSQGKHFSTRFPDFTTDLETEKQSKWITQVFNSGLPVDLSYGNGGLSIRDRDLMITICDREESSVEENEDVFFSRNIGKYSNNIAPLDLARRFSCECDYNLSIGFHASYLYLPVENQAEIYERHMKYIISMYNLYLKNYSDI